MRHAYIIRVELNVADLTDISTTPVDHYNPYRNVCCEVVALKKSEKDFDVLILFAVSHNITLVDIT